MIVSSSAIARTRSQRADPRPGIICTLPIASQPSVLRSVLDRSKHSTATLPRPWLPAGDTAWHHRGGRRHADGAIRRPRGTVAEHVQLTLMPPQLAATAPPVGPGRRGLDFDTPDGEPVTSTVRTDSSRCRSGRCGRPWLADERVPKIPDRTGMVKRLSSQYIMSVLFITTSPESLHVAPSPDACLFEANHPRNLLITSTTT